MSDFLARLALRATDTTAAIRPRPLGRFEPAADPRAAAGFDAADLNAPDNRTATSAPPPILPVDAPPLAARRRSPSVPRPASDAADSAIGERATTPSPSGRGLGRGAETRLAPLAAHPATEAANPVTAQATTPSPSERGLGRGPAIRPSTPATRPASEDADSAIKAQGRRGAGEQGRTLAPSGRELVTRYAPRAASELVTRHSSLVTAKPATRSSPPATPSASEDADSAARYSPRATRHAPLTTDHWLLAHLRAALHPGPDERPLPTAQPPAPAPVVHVHIGRVELRAAPPPSRPSAAARPAPALATVDDYLRRRNGERS